MPIAKNGLGTPTKVEQGASNPFQVPPRIKIGGVPAFNKSKFAYSLITSQNCGNNRLFLLTLEEKKKAEKRRLFGASSSKAFKVGEETRQKGGVAPRADKGKFKDFSKLAREMKGIVKFSLFQFSGEG